MAIRWLEGEVWAESSDQELVALGFARVGQEVFDIEVEGGDLVWVQVNNVAPAHVMDRRFEVDGAEIKAVCMQALADGLSKCVALWHSHFVGEGPSDTDVEFFPNWLADIGVIYHIPTQTSVLYNEDGVFPVLSALNTTRLATQHNTDN